MEGRPHLWAETVARREERVHAWQGAFGIFLVWGWFLGSWVWGCLVSGAPPPFFLSLQRWRLFSSRLLSPGSGSSLTHRVTQLRPLGSSPSRLGACVDSAPSEERLGRPLDRLLVTPRGRPEALGFPGRRQLPACPFWPSLSPQVFLASQAIVEACLPARLISPSWAPGSRRGRCLPPETLRLLLVWCWGGQECDPEAGVTLVSREVEKRTLHRHRPSYWLHWTLTAGSKAGVLPHSRRAQLPQHPAPSPGVGRGHRKGDRADTSETKQVLDADSLKGVLLWMLLSIAARQPARFCPTLNYSADNSTQLRPTHACSLVFIETVDSRPVLPHVFTLSTDHLFIRYGFPLPLYTLWYEL